MHEFTIAEDSLPFDFFEEIEFDFQDVALECIKNRFPDLSSAECEQIFEDHYDLFSDKMFEMRDSSAIYDYHIGEDEVDEGSGTWGYILFEVDDIDKARVNVAAEAKGLLEEVVKDLVL